jgi:hypothetical protein
MALHCIQPLLFLKKKSDTPAAFIFTATEYLVTTGLSGRPGSVR